MWRVGDESVALVLKMFDYEQIMVKKSIRKQYSEDSLKWSVVKQVYQP